MEGKAEFADLFLKIQEDPLQSEVWRKVTELAQEKDYLPGLPELPSTELIEMGEKIRTSKNVEEKYRLLSRRCSTGELWFNVILGQGENLEGIAALNSVIGRRKWDKGLDVGCGIGNSLRPIARHCKKIYGLDIFPFLLEIAETDVHFPKNAALITGNATYLPFGEETFDLVYSNGLGAYLTEEEQLKFLSEVARVLKSGGSYFETLAEKKKNKPVPSDPKSFLLFLLGEMISGGTKTRSISVWERIFTRKKFKWIFYESAKQGRRWIRGVIEFRKEERSLL